jgi:hypothetical protein
VFRPEPVERADIRYAVLLNFTVPLMLAKWQVKATFLFVALGIP